MEENELKTDRKIDMLRQAGLISEVPYASTTTPRHIREEEDDDVSAYPSSGRFLILISSPKRKWERLRM